MDRSIPHISVIMKKASPLDYPRVALPGAYRYADADGDFRERWIAVQLAADHIDTRAEAEAVFEREFGRDPLLAARRSALVLDRATGSAVGVTTVWDGTLFSDAPHTIHWVGVSEAHQGRGLAKAMMTRALDIARDMGNDKPIYLTTQTASYRAINIYRQFGFEPYMGEKPAGWKVEAYDADNPRAWAIIDDKLRAYRR